MFTKHFVCCTFAVIGRVYLKHFVASLSYFPLGKPWDIVDVTKCSLKFI